MLMSSAIVHERYRIKCLVGTVAAALLGAIVLASAALLTPALAALLGHAGIVGAVAHCY